MSDPWTDDHLTDEPHARGFAPSANAEAEEALLGACLLARGALEATLDVPSPTGGSVPLRPADFYKPAHAAIYGAMLDVYLTDDNWDGDYPVNPVTVNEVLDRHGQLDTVGGPSATVIMQANGAAIASARRYARIVLERALLREAAAAATHIAEDAIAFPENVGDFLTDAEGRIAEVGARLPHAKRLIPAADAMAAALEALKTPAPIIPLGLPDLEELADVQPGDVMVLAGLTGHGKTVCGTHIATAAANAGKTVLYVTLEMAAEQLITRVLARDSGVDSMQIRRRDLAPADQLRIDDAALDHAYPTLWFDEADRTFESIKATVARFMRDNPLHLLIIDHFQLVQREPGGRWTPNVEHLDVIAQAMKELARTRNVAVIELMQFNRGSDNGGRPSLTDLRGSAALEHSADLVVGCYDAGRAKENPVPGVMELHVLKARHAAPAQHVELNYQARTHLLTRRPKGHWATHEGEEPATPPPTLVDQDF